MRILLLAVGCEAVLQQVVLVHRHGARFPTKPTGEADLAWPIRAQFWEPRQGL